MKREKHAIVACAILAGLLFSGAASAQPIEAAPVQKWITVTGTAAGTDQPARDRAVRVALRTAVERACGVFLTAQSQTRNYKTVYDKVFADAVGYVRQHEVLKIWVEGGTTHARLRVCVSTQKFEKNWAVIAHTVNQENNPRVIVAIAEAVRHRPTGPTYEVDKAGIVQGRVEDFFLSKGIVLVDRATAAKISKRDVLLAVIKDNTKEIASFGARMKAEVVLTGRAVAKYARSFQIADQTVHQYTATLNVRVVQTDSARVLASKSYGPVTTNTFQRGAEDKVLTKLARETAPKVLAAVVEAWRKRAQVSRTVNLAISGMDYEAWKTFRAEAGKLRGVQALRLREITEAIASIDAEHSFTNEDLADQLTEMKKVKLTVTEITANRIKLKLVKPPASPPAAE